MSAIDTAKEIVRIGATAGLSKDVIDLLEKKAALLAEQAEPLSRENAQLKSEIDQLRHQLQEAHKELNRLKQPPGQPRWGSQPRIRGRTEP